MLERLLHICEDELNYIDMVINCKKSCSCIRIGPRFDIPCATVVSKTDSLVLGLKEMRYRHLYYVLTYI